MINGKPVSWNSATKRWDEVQTPSSGIPGAVAGTAPTLPLIPQLTTYTDFTSTDVKTDAKEQIRLQMLALKQQHKFL